MSKITRFITGHNFMMRHRNVIDNTLDSTCRLCSAGEETSFHIIANCDALWRHRNDIMGHCYLEDSFDWTPHQIIKYITKPQIAELEETSDV